MRFPITEEVFQAVKSVLTGNGWGKVCLVDWPKGQWVVEEKYCIGGDDKPRYFSGKVAAICQLRAYLDELVTIRLIDGQICLDVTLPGCLSSYIWMWFEPDLREWRRAEFHSEREISEWGEAGFLPDEARKWRKKGFYPDSATKWREKGFDPRSARVWDKILFGTSDRLSAAVRWREKGFGADQVESIVLEIRDFQYRIITGLWEWESELSKLKAFLGSVQGE